MNEAKRKKLEAAGWQVGSAEDFLSLSPQEAAYVELRLALSEGLKRRRTDRGITQATLARQIGSSQSRIAKAEASDPGVSMDLLIKALLATGATPADLARLIGKRRRGEAA